MYKKYYGFTEEPFNITPDPRFLYLTSQHREALNHLLYGIRQRKGFICLTGEVGTGKTTLCRALLRQLGEGYQTALILNPFLSETQLLRAVLQEFGINSSSRERLDCLTALNRFLLEVNSAGRDAVLIIDEAQDMSTQTLEMARLLSNLETDSQKLLQIVLIGQPELREMLAKPSLRQLAQRITVRYHLGRMTYEDTEQYIRHRLKVAGLPEAMSGSALRPHARALREIYRYSQGIPRLVNAIGDKTLLAGYVHHTDSISRRIVRRAARELREAVR